MQGTRTRPRLNLNPLTAEQKSRQPSSSKTEMQRLLDKGIQDSRKARMDESKPEGFNAKIWSHTNESEKSFLIKCTKSPYLIVVDDRIELRANPDIHMHLFIKDDSIIIQATSRCEDERSGKCIDPEGGNVSGCHYQVDETLWKGRRGASEPTSRFNRNLRRLLSAYGRNDDNIVVALIERKLLSYNEICNKVCSTTDCDGNRLGAIKKSKRKNKKITKRRVKERKLHKNDKKIRKVKRTKRKKKSKRRNSK